MENLTLTINEVDCYIGNASSSRYATYNATQHQILVNGIPLGRLNKPCDSDRTERVVKTRIISSVVFSSYFSEAVLLKKSMKSEFCNSIEEFELASKENSSSKKKVRLLISKMHEIESLGLSLIDYERLMNY